MKPISFKGHRFPAEIIRHAIWLYARFTLSFRDVEELLAERGVDVSYGLYGGGSSSSGHRSRPTCAAHARSQATIGIRAKW